MDRFGLESTWQQPCGVISSGLGRLLRGTVFGWIGGSLWCCAGLDCKVWLRSGLSMGRYNLDPTRQHDHRYAHESTAAAAATIMFKPLVDALDCPSHCRWMEQWRPTASSKHKDKRSRDAVNVRSSNESRIGKEGAKWGPTQQSDRLEKANEPFCLYC